MDAARNLALHEDPPPEPAARPSPVMEQYIEIKAANPDSLLFYRMGDFYELFFEDAEVASRALGIVLTKRGKHLGRDIPMCGVPIHRADEYLHRLIALGHRVAVCEQLEDPAEARKRGSKSVVRRDVVRLVTPGTLTEDTLLDAGATTTCSRVVRARVSVGRRGRPLRASPGSTSRPASSASPNATAPGLAAEIARLEPGEIVVSDALYSDPELAPYLRTLPAVTPLTRDVFDGATAERRLSDYFAVATTDAFGAMSRLELNAAAACITYVERTQLGKRPPLSPPVREAAGSTLSIDQATRSNLELVRTLSGERRGSLLAAIDRTVTPAGSRLLAQRLAAPLTDPAQIARRLDAVEAFVGRCRGAQRSPRSCSTPRPIWRARWRGWWSAAADRAISPRSATASRRQARSPARLDALAQQAPPKSPKPRPRCAVPIRRWRRSLARRWPTSCRCSSATAASCAPAIWPRSTRPARCATNPARWSPQLQGRYADETGVRALKIRHNNVLGYFVEVTAQHGDKLMTAPLNARFIHRQTLAGQVRFTTTELGELEAKIANAADRALGLELETFERLSAAVIAASDAIKAAAEALAALDVASALAALAVERDYVRPAVDRSLEFVIEGGRHPVVEQAISEPFVANDCNLSAQTRRRENLAADRPQHGGQVDVPAAERADRRAGADGLASCRRSARAIGVLDRLFSRVGAADDLARGRSTFMVEMVETAAILNQAGPRSLVILDEIGRGTATFDGLSIAWAAIEHLHEVNRCRALFATHFHELTALSATLPRLHNATVRVKEWQGEVVFLHEVVPGAADRSYGIQVAKLAGLPPSVIERAKIVLAKLEAEDRATPRGGFDDLPLFAAPAKPAAPDPREAALDALIAALQALNPDEMSPRDALEALYALKSKAPKKA